jgi:metal-responsive CopG/Arc/MetJ family transcriptional regulator
VNLSLPEDLVAQLDEVAGPRKRSAFAEEALRRAIKREQFRTAGEKVAGSLDMRYYPHWRTSEDVVNWVRMMRAEETSTDVDPE